MEPLWAPHPSIAQALVRVDNLTRFLRASEELMRTNRELPEMTHSINVWTTDDSGMSHLLTLSYSATSPMFRG